MTPEQADRLARIESKLGVMSDLVARYDERMHGYTAQMAQIREEMRRDNKAQWHKIDILRDASKDIPVLNSRIEIAEGRIDTAYNRAWAVILIALGSFATAIFSIFKSSPPPGH